MNSTYPEQKPGLVTAIALMTLASGIVNIFWGFVASATMLGTIVGVVCLPISVLPTILGIFELIYGAKLISSQPQPTQPSTSIAVFQIMTILMGNVFSMVVGILALIFYNDLAVKNYFTHLNGGTATASTPTPVAAPVVIKAPEPEALPEPVVEDAAPEEPVKVKRARKTPK